MLKQVRLLFSTVFFLKVIQLTKQIQIRFRKNRALIDTYNMKKIDHMPFLDMIRLNISCEGYIDPNKFSFLNIEMNFEDRIDWNFMEFGKLWNYNLEYFDYLHQNNFSVEEKLRLINDFYTFSLQKKRVLEPYPVSLRAINMIKFAISNELVRSEYLNYVYQELDYLDKSYEFHLLGNHLLENAFALSLGGAFFSNEKWHNRSVEILKKELDEQILSDGAHFELSPMYHKIIFFRVLELIDWYRNYEYRNEGFLQFCSQKAELMLDWMINICFQNGEIPLFNDAANGIAYETKELLEYAEQLGIKRTNISLGNSGYRSFVNENYEIKLDFAQIGASYQPGHAHADALSFILYYEGKPLFVEQGTSTYNIGERRNLERSTEAHNTVVVNGKNQSQVWGGFRLAKRAKTTILLDNKSELKASHDGYKSFGVIHERNFQFEDSVINIRDNLSADKKGVFYLHIHPECSVNILDSNSFLINGKIEVKFNKIVESTIESYDYAESFNKYQKAQRLVISFVREMETSFIFSK